MRSAKRALFLACLAVLEPGAWSIAAPGAEPTGAFAAFQAAEKAAHEAWERMPMAARRVVFAKQPVKQFGAYEPRGDNMFKRGERVVTYIEPVGFAFRDTGDGVLAYGFKVDLVVRTSDGKTLVDKHDYATLDSRTRSRREEVDFSSALDVKDVGAGVYSLEFTFHDLNSDKTMVVKQTFTIID